MLTSLLKPRPIEKIITEKLYDAKREAIEHRAAAEHHKALADMYQARVDRLQQDLAAQDQRRGVSAS